MAATIDGLIPLIYHEKQEAGSMLCAQHALNNLLQGPYFTAPDLSDIAHKLDERENEQRYGDESRRGSSNNMDDTGFFSVQVIENAVQVWGLSLVPWRSEGMRPFQQHPHTQLAFILNSQQHWYTLRRFGRASVDPSLEAEPGEGHWFNLNSFLPHPEWVGKLYLGMVLHQAETEGYSVFAVVQMDPSAPMALARTEADELAASILEPSSVPRLRNYESPAVSSSAPPSRSPPPIEYDDLADVDADLQAALQASLMDRRTTDFALPDRGQSFSVPIASRSNANGGFETPTQVDRGYSVLVESDDDEDMEEDFPQPPVIPPPGFAAPRVIPPPNFAVDDDPIAASRARGQAYMDQVRRQQEAALQNSYQEEIARMEAGVPMRRNTRQAEEDAELQRAIEASRALHEAQGSRSRVNDEDDENADDSDYVPPPQHITPPPSTAIYDSHRVYDDDDAELQAALKASLEDMPEGFRVPSTPPRPQPPSLAAASGPEHLTVPVTTTGEDHDGSDIDTVSEAESSMVVEQPPELSMEEMRRRRLAKFGG